LLVAAAEGGRPAAPEGARGEIGSSTRGRNRGAASNVVRAEMNGRGGGDLEGIDARSGEARQDGQRRGDR
jgi:hypothetical protein